MRVNANSKIKLLQIISSSQMTVDLEDYGVTNQKQLRDADKTLGLHQARATRATSVPRLSEGLDQKRVEMFKALYSLLSQIVHACVLQNDLNAGASCRVCECSS